MDLMAVCGRVMGTEVASAPAPLLQELLADVGRLEAWLASVKVAVAQRLEALAAAGEGVTFPEQVIATAARCPVREAARMVEQAQVLAVVPGFEAALAAGEVTPAHVAALAAAAQQLEPEERARLGAEAGRLVEAARRATPEAFGREARNTAARLGSEEGATRRLQRQRRATFLRTWTEKGTGMMRLNGAFDPERGLVLDGRLQNAVEALFHHRLPQDCPTDERKQDHLRALALLALTGGRLRGDAAEDGERAAASRRAEVIAVIDERTEREGWHEGSVVDVGADVTVPLDVIRAWAAEGTRVEVTLRDGVAVAVDGSAAGLRLGRSQRLASRDQRRALRAMYQRCAIPDCPVRFPHCVPHHVHWWEHGGRTDLENLLPLCARHHALVHQGCLAVSLCPVTRELTVIDTVQGVTMTTGPPGRRAA